MTKFLFSGVTAVTDMTATRISETEPRLTVSPTAGLMRLNQPALAKMGADTSAIADGRQYVQFGNLHGQYFAYLTVSDGDDSNGAKLTSPTKKLGGTLNATSKSVWLSLGGKTSKDTDGVPTRQVYAIGEACVGADENGFITEEAALEAGKVTKGDDYGVFYLLDFVSTETGNDDDDTAEAEAATESAPKKGRVKINVEE